MLNVSIKFIMLCRYAECRGAHSFPVLRSKLDRFRPTAELIWGWISHEAYLEKKKKELSHDLMCVVQQNGIAPLYFLNSCSLSNFN